MIAQLELYFCIRATIFRYSQLVISRYTDFVDNIHIAHLVFHIDDPSVRYEFEIGCSVEELDSVSRTEPQQSLPVANSNGFQIHLETNRSNTIIR
jgi:hypothetical protein